MKHGGLQESWQTLFFTENSLCVTASLLCLTANSVSITANSFSFAAQFLTARKKLIHYGTLSMFTALFLHGSLSFFTPPQHTLHLHSTRSIFTVHFLSSRQTLYGIMELTDQGPVETDANGQVPRRVTIPLLMSLFEMAAQKFRSKKVNTIIRDRATGENWGGGTSPLFSVVSLPNLLIP